MTWNLDKIRFLHPPDDFTGSFSNPKMQERHLAMQKQKLQEIHDKLESESHPQKAMQVLNGLEHIKFVINNLDRFKQSKSYEETVLALYYRKNTPFASAGDYPTWKFLFEQCDRDLLRQQGQPLPKESFTAYRGSVTGIAKGFSWTIDKKKVAWILNRWSDKSLGGGTVFSLSLNKADVMAYVEDKERKEVIVTPSLAEALNAKPVSEL